MTITRGAPRLPAKDQADEDTRKLYLRKAHHMADTIGFDDEMRHDLALMIVSVDKDSGGSWAALDINQLHELIMYLEGYCFVSFMIEQRS